MERCSTPQLMTHWFKWSCQSETALHFNFRHTWYLPLLILPWGNPRHYIKVGSTSSSQRRKLAYPWFWQRERVSFIRPLQHKMSQNAQQCSAQEFRAFHLNPFSCSTSCVRWSMMDIWGNEIERSCQVKGMKNWTAMQSEPLLTFHWFKWFTWSKSVKDSLIHWLRANDLHKYLTPVLHPPLSKIQLNTLSFCFSRIYNFIRVKSNDKLSINSVSVLYMASVQNMTVKWPFSFSFLFFSLFALPLSMSLFVLCVCVLVRLPSSAVFIFAVCNAE